MRGIETFSDAAAGILFVTAGLAVAIGIGFVLFPLPRYLGVEVPTLYRYLLAVMAVVGGGIHYLAGRWCTERRNLFRTVAATLVGMVILQVSVPLDLLAIGFLVLGRHEFES